MAYDYLQQADKNNLKKKKTPQMWPQGKYSFGLSPCPYFIYPLELSLTWTIY